MFNHRQGSTIIHYFLIIHFLLTNRYNMKTIKGKVILVTGSGRGFGRGMAYAYAVAGAKVVTASRTISELESLSDLQDAAAFKITELNKKKRLNQISEVEYNIAKQGFESQYSNAKQGIQDMNLAKNIDFLKANY